MKAQQATIRPTYCSLIGRPTFEPPFELKSSIVIYIFFLFVPPFVMSFPLPLFMAIGVVYFRYSENRVAPIANPFGFNTTGLTRYWRSLILLSLPFIVVYGIFIAVRITLNHYEPDSIHELSIDTLPSKFLGDGLVGIRSDIASIFDDAVTNGELFRSIIIGSESLFNSLIHAPLLESLVLFTIVFPALWKRFGRRYAVWMTVLLFAAPHGQYLSNLWGFLVVSILGYIWCRVYIATKSFYHLYATHALWNAYMYVYIYVFMFGIPFSN